MPSMWLGLALGFLVSAFVVLALAYARAGGLQRAWWGLTVAGRGAQNPDLDAKIHKLMGDPTAPVSMPTAPAPTMPPPPAPPKPTGESLKLLRILQSEARLLDFLLEDLSKATDVQIGAGAREVHNKAAAILKKHLVIEPVLSGTEGDRTTVPAGFDPSAIRLLGNVTGTAPFHGELQHPGWKVKEIKLPTVAEGQDPMVLQPAEVQL